MKKGIIAVSSLGGLGIALFLIFGNLFAEEKEVSENPSVENKKVSWDGKTDGYASAKEMKEQVGIIVKGKKVSEDENIVLDSEISEEPAGGYTKSSFKISKVLKNSGDDEAISVGSAINISGSEFYDKNSKTTYTINDYENMKSGKEYVLYLKPIDEGMYTTAGVTFGKVPVNTDETELVESEVNEPVNEVINEVQQELGK
ncbi:hypothetical protein [Listeria grandensis]|uniref:hypothetical protein n=1 Tax=Listeria grandensis TaxID=1494963 RepID=UPI00164DDAF8|nr:hypothetical protein [Listeria grandensis]MBC6315168.1 hypothetical protein [Listeria grandensis]